MAIRVDENGSQVSTEKILEKEIQENILTRLKNETKILTEEEYNKLDPEEKMKYIPYNPSMSDKAISAMVRQANSQIKALTKMMPAFENIKFVPTPLPSEKLAQTLDSVDKMVSLLDPVEKLAGVKIIGQLVKPLVKLINAIFMVIGQQFYLIFALAKGQEFFMDSVTETFDQLDTKGIKDAFTDMGKQKTVSVENMNINWDAIPTSKHYEEIKKFKEDLDKTTSMTVMTDAAVKVQKKVVELTMKQHTWQFYSDKIMNIMGKLGVDFSLLDKPTENEMKKFENLFPDPKKIAYDLTSGINKMVAKTYISIEDNEKIKNQEEKVDSL